MTLAKTLLLLYITAIGASWALAYFRYSNALKGMSMRIRAALGIHLEQVRNFVRRCAWSHVWMILVMATMIADHFVKPGWYDYFAITLYLFATYPLTEGGLYSLRAARDLKKDVPRINDEVSKFFG